VTYRVRFEGHALVQLHGLPSEGFDALLARVVELVGRTMGRGRDAPR
jgi:hypothetical protein